MTGTEGVEFCLQPDKGKRYPRSLVMTLLEKLLIIPKCGKFLKDALKPEILLNKERECSDNEATTKLAAAKRK